MQSSTARARLDKRSDGKSCRQPLIGPCPEFKGELCPKCKTNDYSMTTAGCIHNSIRCSCGWVGCECELVILED